MNTITVVGNIGGDAEPRVWQTQSGEHRAGIDITAQRIRLLGGGREEQPAAQDDSEVPW